MLQADSPNRMEGFIILDFMPQFPEAVKQMAIWLSQGKIKAKNTIVKGGLQQAEYALNDLFKGMNTGKPRLMTSEVAKEADGPNRQACGRGEGAREH